MRVLVTGAGGQVGSEIARQLQARDGDRKRDRIEAVAADHRQLDVSRRDQVLATLCQLEPDLVFHCAAWTEVDACEGDPQRAFAVNALGCRYVAEGARLTGAHVVYVSSDYVFDGRSDRPYCEWDEARPLSVYGRSKLGGERELDPGWTVVRTSWVVSGGEGNILGRILRMGREGSRLRFVDDRRASPTVASDLAGKLLELGLARRPGLFHVTNSGEATWFVLASEVLRRAGIAATVEPIAAAELDPPQRAERPANSVLANVALAAAGDELLPDWRESVGRLVAGVA